MTVKFPINKFSINEMSNNLESPMTTYDVESYYPTLGSKIFHDSVDIKIAEKINNNIDLVLAKLKRVYTLDEINRMKNIVGSIVINNKQGLPNKYNYAKKNLKTDNYEGFEFGRLFCPTSLQGLKRELRHTIVNRDNCVDIDMVNAHPCILNQISSLLGAHAPTLDNYIINRRALLEEIIREYKIDYEEAKTIPLIIINGGARSSTYSKISWLRELEHEIGKIYDSIMKTAIGKRIDLHIETVNKKNDDGELIHADGRVINKIGSTINLLLCKIENEILTQCVLFFESKKIAVYTLCFDGLIVSNCNTANILHELEEIPRILERGTSEEYVYSKLKLQMKFSVKPFDSYIEHIPEAIQESIQEIDFTNPGITFVQANMGYGKTTKLLAYLKNKKEKNILIVTPRKSLAKEFAINFQNLGFVHYLESTKALILICQVDSLYKVIRKYDIVILDEVETILNHIVSFDKMAEKDQILFKLECVMRDCEQLFVMDANLSAETRGLFQNGKHQITDLKYYYKTFKGRKCTFIIDNKCVKLKTLHTDHVLRCIGENRKVACPVSSLSYLKDLNLSILKKFPTCKVLLISIEHEFTSVDEFINYDVVIYTSTLLCGNNFDLAHFNIMLPYVSNLHSSGKIYSQQLLRIRKFDEMTVYIYIDKSKLIGLTTEARILARWRHDYSERAKKGVKYDCTLDQFQKDFYFKLILKQTIEMENAPSLLLIELHQILTNHGFEIEIRPNTDMQVIDQLQRYNKQEDFIKIIQADRITYSQLDAYTYTPHEYLKHVIEKTFRIQLDLSMIKFVKDVHDKIGNHDNFMLLNKYSVDQVMQLYDTLEVIKLQRSSIFIPKSKANLRDNWLYCKALQFVKKYDIMSKINNELKVDNIQFIKWFGIPKPEKNIALTVSKLINKLLKVHGLQIISRLDRDNQGKRFRINVVTPLIDYSKFDIQVLLNRSCYNLDIYLRTDSVSDNDTKPIAAI